MLITVTVNPSGFISMWIDNPYRLENRWKGNYLFINSLIHEKIKQLVKDTQMSWESEPITIPIPNI